MVCDRLAKVPVSAELGVKTYGETNKQMLKIPSVNFIFLDNIYFILLSIKNLL